MNRVDVRAEARDLLEQLYAAEDIRESGRDRLTSLARAALDAGVPLAEHGDGPWRSDRCRYAHTDAHSGGAGDGALTCVMRGEFELPLREQDAADVAALLNWAEVPEPGAQT